MITLSLPRSGACNLAILVPLCSPHGCCVVLAVSECNTAKCSLSAVCPPWEAFDQLRCCVCFRVSLLAFSAPWLSGVLSELKPGFLQIVFSRIRRRVHDTSLCIFVGHGLLFYPVWSPASVCLCKLLHLSQIQVADYHVVIGQQLAPFLTWISNTELNKSAETMQKSISDCWPKEYLHHVYLCTSLVLEVRVMMHSALLQHSWSLSLSFTLASPCQWITLFHCFQHWHQWRSSWMDSPGRRCMVVQNLKRSQMTKRFGSNCTHTSSSGHVWFCFHCQVAIQTEDAAKVAKETVYSPKSVPALAIAQKPGWIKHLHVHHDLIHRKIVDFPRRRLLCSKVWK